MQTLLPQLLELIADKYLPLHGDRTETDVPFLSTGLLRVGNARFAVITSNPSVSSASLSSAALRQAARIVDLGIRLRCPVLLWEPGMLLGLPRNSLALAAEQQELLRTVMSADVWIIIAAAEGPHEIAEHYLRISELAGADWLRERLTTIAASCEDTELLEITTQRRLRIERELGTLDVGTPASSSADALRLSQP